MDEQRPKNRDLQERLFAFALRVVHVCRSLQDKPGVGRTLGQQLLRAGTSAGANYEEGQAGQSRADFISKTCIALKEAREAHYWLRLLVAADVLPIPQLAALVDEAGQLVKILGSVVAHSRQHS